jgi:hypothetical protein
MLKPLSQFKTLFPIFLALSLTSCKSGTTSSFDLLGGDDSNIEQLTIDQALPDVSNVSLEIGESSVFSISARAPTPRQVSYTWTLDGIPVSNTGNTSITASLANIGTYTLKAAATDGLDIRERTWTVKVNGPPVITPVTTGTTKVSTTAFRNITATASDPNGDTLTYTWTLNGSASAYLTGTNGTGTLTGDPSIAGTATVSLTVSDGTASTSYSWPAEINYFPDACNTLSTGSICTYGGNPHKGNGVAVNNTTFPLRLAPLGHTQDALGNVFISDNDHYVIWYWNKTGAAVTRLGTTIAANTIQVVAGTGELATGSAGLPALQSPLNQPRGLWYNDLTGTLYIAEYGSSRVKFVNSSGTVFIGMGTTASNVDGDLAYNHQCSNPSSMFHYSGSLYIACYGSHRIKRWDLATDLGYHVAGSGANNVTGTNVAPTAGGTGNPYTLFVNADGIYIGTWTGDVIRYVNTTGAPKTFWSGNADQVTVNANSINTIAGDGGTGAIPLSANPRSIPLNNPTGIVVRNSNEIYVIVQGRHNVVLFNDSPVGITIDGVAIASKTAGRLNHASGGYSGGASNISVSKMNQPYDLSIDVNDSDSLIVSDYVNRRVRSIDLSSEKIVDLAGSGNGKAGTIGATSAPSQEHYFNTPGGLTFNNSTGDLYFVDMNNYMIRQIDKIGIISTPLGRGAGDPSIDNDIPSNTLFRTNSDGTNNVMNGIELLSDGSLIQINAANTANNFRVWNRTGADKTYYSIFVQNNRVNTVGGDWTLGAGNGASGQLGTDTQLNYPTSVRANGTSLFVVDSANHCIRELTAPGTMNTVLGLCGTSGDPVSQNLVAASARFFRPKDIAFDSANNMYISDYSNNKIRFWNRGGTPVTIGSVTIPAGNVATIACFSGGGGSASEGIQSLTSRCDTPTGLAYDSVSNRLCYSQKNRHNVRCISIATGIVNTVAGLPEASPRAGSTLDLTQEGISGTNAPLYNPTGIAFDAFGDLYISDSTNHVIKKVKLSP